MEDKEQIVSIDDFKIVCDCKKKEPSVKILFEVIPLPSRCRCEVFSKDKKLGVLYLDETGCKIGTGPKTVKELHTGHWEEFKWFKGIKGELE